MNQNDGSSNRHLNLTKNAVRPLDEAVESHTGNANTSEDQKIDRVATESAKPAQDRIHNDEERTTGGRQFFRGKWEFEEQQQLRQQRKKQLQLQKKTQIPFGDDNEKERPRSFAGPFCERFG